MWALVAAPPCLGVPGGSALTAGETNFCGDPSLDIYFNKHCSNAVAKVAEHCCDEFPPSDKCDEWRMACINTHVKDGRCSDPTDCEPGCRLFNSMTATCCPHVKAKTEKFHEPNYGSGHGRSGRRGQRALFSALRRHDGHG